MQIPKRLKIGGHVYTIEIISGHKKHGDFIKKDCGQTEVGQSVIKIDGDQTPSQIEETFIHEIFHAINNTLAHDLLHSLAHSFHQVLRDNKLIK